jgi:chromatin segregation and condensation protein Rec8/ScpA/Scc1 (kleisin family)
MANSLYDSPGSSNDKRRVPSFDEYRDMNDMIDRYQDQLRPYFSAAQTHHELDKAYKDVKDSDDADFPDKIITFFYKERERALGPRTNINFKGHEDTDERDLKQRFDNGEEAKAQNLWGKYRATYT